MDQTIEKCLNAKAIGDGLPAGPGSSGLLTGQAGIAVFLNEMAQLDNSRVLEKASRDHFAAILSVIPEQFLKVPLPDPSLVSGLSGIALALVMASRDGTRYQKVLSEIDRHLLPLIHRYVAYCHSHPMHVRLYDLLYGLSGMLLYTLSRPGPEALAASEAIAEYFDSRTRAAVSPLQGFAIEQTQQSTPRHAKLYPRPTVDLGLAHGVAGVVASLALALMAQPTLKARFAPTLHLLTEGLVDQRLNNGEGAWPSHWTPEMPLQEHVPARIAWCYGIPGIASALRLSSEALDASQYRAIALEVLTGITPGLSSLTTSNLCHGSAGLLQVVERFGDPQLMPLASQLRSMTLAQHDDLAPYGFWSEADPVSGQVASMPLLLEGALGVWLALTHSELPNPLWDRALALA
ncbi:lanthionine synthetase C family protein [Deinococcus cellulosilyticus]|nr:lanthionine synthetase C family protein [Deinococcus cellulosilyticus]